MQDYCQFAPNGHEILQADVRRLYHDDDATADFEDCKVSDDFSFHASTHNYQYQRPKMED